jgi:hypothetical protein
MPSPHRITAKSAAICALAAVLCGCASSGLDTSGPSYLTLSRAQYEQVFLAACEVARSEGLAPEMTDRQTGTITTGPRSAGSVMEPWTWQQLTANDVVAGTFGFERRRATFEFVPVGFTPQPTAQSAGAAPLAGAILPGSERGQGASLPSGLGAGGAEGEGTLELRVSVSVERQFRPGYQGTPYTRALGSFSRDVTDEKDSRGNTGGDPVVRDRANWTPVARDERLERELIAQIQRRMQAAPQP